MSYTLHKQQAFRNSTLGISTIARYFRHPDNDSHEAGVDEPLSAEYNLKVKGLSNDVQPKTLVKFSVELTTTLQRS